MNVVEIQHGEAVVTDSAYLGFFHVKRLKGQSIQLQTRYGVVTELTDKELDQLIAFYQRNKLKEAS